MPLRSTLTISVLIIVTLLVSACGTIAELRPPAPPTPEPYTLAPRPTQVADSALSDQPTAVPPTATATDVPPTATSTPTEVPPTATATSTPTELPTETPEVASGDPASGEVLFNSGKDAAPACVTCHRIDEDVVLIGPALVGIAGRAGEQVEGQSAEEYLHLSIVEPNDYLVPNTDVNVFAAGDMSLMFQQYTDYLTDEDVDDLVAYMLTLE